MLSTGLCGLYTKNNHTQVAGGRLIK